MPSEYLSSSQLGSTISRLFLHIYKVMKLLILVKFELFTYHESGSFVLYSAASFMKSHWSLFQEETLTDYSQNIMFLQTNSQYQPLN